VIFARLRELLAVVVLERRRGFVGVLEVFGVVDVGKGGLGAAWADFGSAASTFAIL
jgi:hypothetical protein